MELVVSFDQGGRIVIDSMGSIVIHGILPVSSQVGGTLTIKRAKAA